MVLPSAQLEAIFNVQPGEKQVTVNLKLVSLQIVDYFREVMPVFLSLISHLSFDIQNFLKRHTMPGMQLNIKLTEYLNTEAHLGRIHTGNSAAAAEVLLSYLHNLALSERIGSQRLVDTERSISQATALLWTGMAP